MVKRALLVLALAGLYLYLKQRREATAVQAEQAAEAEWANEGGGNPSTAV